MTTEGAKSISEIGPRIWRRHAAFVAVIVGKYAPQCRARGRALLWHLRPFAGSAVVHERLIERRALVERWLMQPLNVSVALQYEAAFGRGAAGLFGASNRYPPSGRDQPTVARRARLLLGVPRPGGSSSGFDVGERATKFIGFLGAAFRPNATPLPVRAGDKQQTSVESRCFYGLIFRDAHLLTNRVLADFVSPVLRHKDVLRLLAARHVDASGCAFPRRREFDAPASFARPGAQRLFQRHRDGSLVPVVRTRGPASRVAQRLYADVSMSAATDRRVEAEHGPRATAGMSAMKFLRGDAILESRQPRVSGARAMADMSEQSDVGWPGSVAASLTRDGGSSLLPRSLQGAPLWRNRLNFVDRFAAQCGAVMGRRIPLSLLTRAVEPSAVGRASARHVGLKPDLQKAMNEPKRRAASGSGGHALPTNIIAARDRATITHTRSTADVRTFATFEQRSFPLRNGNARQVLLRGAGAMQGKPAPSALGNGGGVAHVVGRRRTAAGGLTLRMQGARMLPTFAAASRWARFVVSGSAPSDGTRGRKTAELVVRPAVPPGAATDAVAQKSVTQTTVAARINGTPTNAAPTLDIERIAQQVQTLLERKTRIERTRRGL